MQQPVNGHKHEVFRVCTEDILQTYPSLSISDRDHVLRTLAVSEDTHPFCVV